MLKTRYVIGMGFLTTLLYSCSEVTMAPEDYKPIPVGVVAENTSLYTEGLKCLGRVLVAKATPEDLKLMAAVGIIQDKTGRFEKGGAILTQSASEMALTAISRIGVINVVGTTDATDLLQYQFTQSPNSNVLMVVGNIGSIIRSDYFLTGSISEFNEDLRNRNWGFNLGGSLFHKLTGTDVSGQDSIISVAMDLRLVSSKSGAVLRNSQNELLVVSLNNNIVTKQYNGSLFRIFGEGNANSNFGMKISDPRHLAIREIVEAGTLILMGKLYEVPWEPCFNQKPVSGLKPQFSPDIKK